MASEIPNDLIQKVQALLRKESGLSTYDPHDPSIHPLPSLDASISELDKSTPPEIPRCTKCNAKFLRGTKSLICIYCGSKKQDDDLPGPISFNSSSGCRWLLNSLDLDESQSVGSLNESFEVNKHHKPPKHDNSLRKLLDFRISLLEESEKPKTRVANKALEQNRSLNLTGAYLGNIFSKSPSMIVYDAVVPAEPVTEQIGSSQSKAFVVGEEKLASSSKISLGDSVVTTSETYDSKVSQQDENLSGSSPGDTALKHSDVAKDVDDNQLQANNTSEPSDSTIDRHEDSVDN
ncbi:hypothetical protein DCAR_0418165 [Daucus carota subsp. sativus]|uniref:DUF7815 domain-containing protein n=1 Tax=Daucus carota subsp. sativus TaxID=79200 RepID=A0AAF1B056_DAUCS|nr:hypothetical protein DCAR_0418165 [Daucus carota subsp. sativus]